MHMIKYKNCLAQQDNKTLEVVVSKNGLESICYDYYKRLSDKELRTVVNRYLCDINKVMKTYNDLLIKQ